MPPSHAWQWRVALTLSSPPTPTQPSLPVCSHSSLSLRLIMLDDTKRPIPPPRLKPSPPTCSWLSRCWYHMSVPAPCRPPRGGRCVGDAAMLPPGPDGGGGGGPCAPPPPAIWAAAADSSSGSIQRSPCMLYQIRPTTCAAARVGRVQAWLVSLGHGGNGQAWHCADAAGSEVTRTRSNPASGSNEYALSSLSLLCLHQDPFRDSLLPGPHAAPCPRRHTSTPAFSKLMERTQ